MAARGAGGGQVEQLDRDDPIVHLDHQPSHRTGEAAVIPAHRLREVEGRDHARHHRRDERIDGGGRALGDGPQQAVALDQVAGRQPMLSREARPRLFGGIGFRPTHLLALRRTLGGESGGDRRDPAGADVHTDGVRIQPCAVEGIGEQAGNLTLGFPAGDRREILTTDLDQKVRHPAPRPRDTSRPPPERAGACAGRRRPGL